MYLRLYQVRVGATLSHPVRMPYEDAQCGPESDILPVPAFVRGVMPLATGFIDWRPIKTCGQEVRLFAAYGVVLGMSLQQGGGRRITI